MKRKPLNAQSQSDISFSSNKKTKSTAVEKSMKKTTSVTSYVFGAPRPYKTALGLTIFSLIAGFLINFDLNNFEQNFSGQTFYSNAIIYGLFLLGLPALLSGLISMPLAHLLGGTFYYRRSFLLSFFSTIILVVVLFLGKLFDLFFSLESIIFIIFGYALILSVRHSVLLATSNHKHLNTLPASINQTIFGFLFICIIPGSPYQYSTQAFVYMIVFSIIFLITTFLWIWIVKGPFRRNFNTDGLLLMKQSLTQFTEDIDSGMVLEKEFFSKLGQKSNIRLGVVCIKNKSEKPSTKLDTLMVIPSIHPGPFGILGGANLPAKLSEHLSALTNNLMVFHGPATHDQNPVKSSECVKLAHATSKLVENTEYSDHASKFHRIKLNQKDENENSRSYNENSNLNICAQRFGNGNIYVHTSAPDSTDDIDYPTGEAIIKKAEYETNQKSLFIDAHNCLEPGTGVTFFGSKKANNMLELVSRLNKEFKSSVDYKVSVGFASYTRFRISHGIGPAGIQVLVVKYDPKQKNAINKTNNDNSYEKSKPQVNAYILIDGNNIVPGLRERILKSVFNTNLGDSFEVVDAEVFTTDNHVVNATMGGYNPVGLKLDQEQIIKQVCRLVKEAIANCKPSQVGVNSGIVKNIQVFGHNSIMRLSTTINSTISIMRSSLIACQALAIIACWVVVLL